MHVFGRWEEAGITGEIHVENVQTPHCLVVQHLNTLGRATITAMPSTKFETCFSLAVNNSTMATICVNNLDNLLLEFCGTVSFLMIIISNVFPLTDSQFTPGRQLKQSLDLVSPTKILYCINWGFT